MLWNQLSALENIQKRYLTRNAEPDQKIDESLSSAAQLLLNEIGNLSSQCENQKCFVIFYNILYNLL